MSTAVRGPVAVRAPGHRARAPGRAVAAAPALAPRDVPCHGRDHVQHRKTLRSPINFGAVV